jgi:hypothetical protein
MLFAFQRFSHEAVIKLYHIGIHNGAQYYRAKQMGTYLINCYMWSVHQRNTTLTWRTSNEHCTFREHIFTYAKHDASALLLNLVNLLSISF